MGIFLRQLFPITPMANISIMKSQPKDFYLLMSLLDLLPFANFSKLFSGSLGIRRMGEGVFLDEY